MRAAETTAAAVAVLILEKNSIRQPSEDSHDVEWQQAAPLPVAWRSPLLKGAPSHGIRGWQRWKRVMRRWAERRPPTHLSEACWRQKRRRRRKNRTNQATRVLKPKLRHYNGLSSGLCRCGTQQGGRNQRRRERRLALGGGTVSGSHQRSSRGLA